MSFPRAVAEQPLFSSTHPAHGRLSGTWAESTSELDVLVSPWWCLRAHTFFTEQEHSSAFFWCPQCLLQGWGQGMGSGSTTSIYRDWGLWVSHILQVYSHISPGVGVLLWPETGRDSVELPKAQGGNWLMRAGYCHFWSGLLTVPM